MGIRHLLTIEDRGLPAVHYVLGGDDFSLIERTADELARQWKLGQMQAAAWRAGLVEKKFADEFALEDYRRVYADQCFVVKTQEMQGDNLRTTITGENGCGEMVFFRRFDRDLAWLHRQAA